MVSQPRHPVTGRWLAFDCEVDCLEHCAGLCGLFDDEDDEGADELTCEVARRELRQRVDELDAALDDLTDRGEALRQEIEACMDEWGKAMAELEELRRG